MYRTERYFSTSIFRATTTYIRTYGLTRNYKALLLEGGGLKKEKNVRNGFDVFSKWFSLSVAHCQSTDKYHSLQPTSHGCLAVAYLCLESCIHSFIGILIAGSFTEVYTQGTLIEYTVCPRGLTIWYEVPAILKCNYKTYR